MPNTTDPGEEGLSASAQPPQVDKGEVIHVTGWQHQRNGSIVFACVPEGHSLSNGETVRVGSVAQAITLSGISATGQDGGTIQGRAIVKIPVPQDVPMQRTGSPITKVQ